MPRNWFRRNKHSGEGEQRAEAQAPETSVAPEPATPSGEHDQTAPPSSDTETAARPKRRRGTRGGRNRRKSSTPAAAETAEPAAEPKEQPAKEKKPARGRQERKEKEVSQRRARRESQPRRRAPRRAPLPKAKRELLVSVDAGEKRVAVLEDGRVAEVYLERPERRSIAGNIYKGVVDNVLPGMEAAFVEIGLEKNGFLYVDEIVGPELEGRRGARKIQDLISRGQEVMVQAVKDPMKTKGARLTTEISLPGRFVVYQPFGEGLGVSRRLEDEERSRLKAILKELAPKKGGLIVRTAAEGASAEDIRGDIEFLERLWKTIEARAKEVKAPSLVYQEAELPLRVTRDLFTGDFERLLVDHDRTHKRVVGYLKKVSPHMVERVVRYKEKEPLMDAFGVDAEIRSTLNKRVDLPSGGYLIFDYAEAFTVIDVNTGRFVGGRGKNSNSRLEDTITKNNLEAVVEVVRQLRLRDIGGIIVIDFIDMANPKNRQAVEEALRTELERDRTKTYVVEISPLGLVEMTRQNVTDGPREVMTKKCPTCGGDGIVVSEQTAAVDVERRLRQLVTPGSRTQAYRVEVNGRIATALIGPGASRLAEIEELTRRTFFLVPSDDAHLDHFAVLEQGTLEKLRPQAPFEVGKTVSVELGELGRYDAHAGVGKLDGYSVVVADAAKLVGKTVKVQVRHVFDGFAHATLVTPVAPASVPITAESEAEKPTRARKAAKAVEPEAEAAEVAEVAEPEQAEAVAEPEPETEDGEAPAKKRTRRGSRGGRRRKKKPAEGGEEVAADGEPEPEAAPEPEAEAEPESEEPAPRIHVPPPDLGEEDGEDGDGASPRKRTRRGSRGGRRRKKPAAAAGEPAGEDAPVALEQPEPEPAEAPEEPSRNGDSDEAWEYVPMSEWEDDFRRE
ncbi:MAG TPA: Rne/Rng family ribonuclease [Gaiellaceae bacterium]|nr:Rne/Rng family ribonuclease [Gaiellaceae bacterium]